MRLLVTTPQNDENAHAKKPVLVDLFCKAGGCTAGYQAAGFYVIGVDIAPQPRYVGNQFVQMDAIEFLHRWFAARKDVGPVVAFAASPPCQHFSRMTKCRPGLADEYPDLVAPIRKLLALTGLPFIIENVPGAPLRDPVKLCGCQFGLRSPRGLTLRRERWFETNWPMFGMLPPHNHSEPALPVTGHSPGKEWSQRYVERYGQAPGLTERRTAMGVPWMNRDETSEAIRPAFTEWIGGHLLDHLALVDEVLA